jgi:hypothetical protein
MIYHLAAEVTTLAVVKTLTNSVVVINVFDYKNTKIECRQHPHGYWLAGQVF